MNKTAGIALNLVLLMINLGSVSIAGYNFIHKQMLSAVIWTACAALFMFIWPLWAIQFISTVFLCHQYAILRRKPAYVIWAACLVTTIIAMIWGACHQAIAYCFITLLVMHDTWAKRWKRPYQVNRLLELWCASYICFVLGHGIVILRTDPQWLKVANSALFLSTAIASCIPVAKTIYEDVSYADLFPPAVSYYFHRRRMRPTEDQSNTINKTNPKGVFGAWPDANPSHETKLANEDQIIQVIRQDPPLDLRLDLNDLDLTNQHPIGHLIGHPIEQQIDSTRKPSIRPNIVFLSYSAPSGNRLSWASQKEPFPACQRALYKTAWLDKRLRQAAPQTTTPHTLLRSFENWRCDNMFVPLSKLKIWNVGITAAECLWYLESVPRGQAPRWHAPLLAELREMARHAKTPSSYHRRRIQQTIASLSAGPLCRFKQAIVAWGNQTFQQSLIHHGDATISLPVVMANMRCLERFQREHSSNPNDSILCARQVFEFAAMCGCTNYNLYLIRTLRVLEHHLQKIFLFRPSSALLSWEELDGVCNDSKFHPQVSSILQAPSLDALLDICHQVVSNHQFCAEVTHELVHAMQTKKRWWSDSVIELDMPLDRIALSMYNHYMQNQNHPNAIYVNALASFAWRLYPADDQRPWMHWATQRLLLSINMPALITKDILQHRRSRPVSDSLPEIKTNVDVFRHLYDEHQRHVPWSIRKRLAILLNKISPEKLCQLTWQSCSLLLNRLAMLEDEEEQYHAKYTANVAAIQASLSFSLLHPTSSSAAVALATYDDNDRNDKSDETDEADEADESDELIKKAAWIQFVQLGLLLYQEHGLPKLDVFMNSVACSVPKPEHQSRQSESMSLVHESKQQQQPCMSYHDVLLPMLVDCLYPL